MKDSNKPLLCKKCIHYHNNKDDRYCDYIELNLEHLFKLVKGTSIYRCSTFEQKGQENGKK